MDLTAQPSVQTPDSLCLGVGAGGGRGGEKPFRVSLLALKPLPLMLVFSQKQNELPNLFKLELTA